MKSIKFVGFGCLFGFFLASIVFLFSFPYEVKPKVARTFEVTSHLLDQSNHEGNSQHVLKQFFDLEGRTSKEFNENTKKASFDSVPTSIEQEIKFSNPISDTSTLLETIQDERRATLKEACKRLEDKNICSSDINGIHNKLFYSKTYKLIACDVLKCGYKSWVTGFFAFENKREEYLKLTNRGSSVLALGEKLFRLDLIENQTIKQEAFDNALKVILVRHPFSRLVSAYYDKMVPTSVSYQNYYGRISRDISQNYRHLRHNVTERNQTDDGNATFEDFVNFLIRLKSFDNHWKSFRDLCAPCSSQYDYIAKFETLNNDMEYLKQKINLTEEHRKYFFPKSNFATNFDLMKKTFEKVPNELAHRLYEVYKEDFQMFGYSLPEWMCYNTNKEASSL